ncbi:P-loop containing nucleoside triphosphate hydrolase protein [Halteromyces radiatus]|uniref:P-loop containing nucleoside triphosphate hydrolase protein n=1 Tax=Halteromyces radiatus TaxID=101107 RepID=UPI00221EADBA|nr:P-loop containing nucleoside triphosphate hydrolase protein [Halteromyces radiatus]KAI8083150.1 P-loop containing nucleoside triphosphate hydrolase protein [Halteromyces radiatus]
MFVSIVPKRIAIKWRGYLSQRFFDSSAISPKLYFPRHCPSSDSTLDTNHMLMCAKPVPSFIFAGSEMSGSKYVFEQLRQHPQVAWTMDSSPLSTENMEKTSSSSSSPIIGKKGNTGFSSLDDDDVDDGQLNSDAAFEAYLSQFPFLTDYELNNIEKQQVVVGEHAPHYLYKSYFIARRIRETLPHVKLVFILRDPIDRAYTQFLNEKASARHKEDGSSLSFDSLVDLELSILRRCGHTSTQTGWEGFVRCHQGSEIRATWNLTSNNDSDTLKVYDSLAKGMYYNALLPFLQQFPASQVYVTRTEDFINNPSQSFQKLARFLGIQEQFFSERNFYGRMKSTKDDDLSSLILQQQQLGRHLRHPSSSSSRSHHYRPQQRVPIMAMEQELSADDEEVETSSSSSSSSSQNNLPHQQEDVLDLSIRYRLEKLFRPLNQRLLELFEHEDDFRGWDYDVDRG